MNGAVGGVRSLLRLVLVLGATGCGPVVIGIDYQAAGRGAPTAGAGGQCRAAGRENVRGGERGGQTERVGTIYNYSQGMYGPPQYDGRPINATTPDAVADTVRAATIDALSHAGVSVRNRRPDAGRVGQGILGGRARQSTGPPSSSLTTWSTATGAFAGTPTPAATPA